MPKSGKRFSGETSNQKELEFKQEKQRKRKRNNLLSFLLILAVVIVVGVGSWYLIYKTPYQRPIIKVNNQSVKVDYLLRRMLGSSSDDLQSTMQNIVIQLMVKQNAPQYGITVTEADIDQALRDEANATATSDDETATEETTTPTTEPTTTETTTGATEPTTTEPTPTLSDAEYREWYQQKIKDSYLSEKEFRELVGVNLMAQRLQEYLGDKVPTTAEHVHLYGILLNDYATAVTVRQLITDGGDFMTIASQFSEDDATKDTGGDMGWVPVPVLDDNIRATVTGLEIGAVSDPVQTSVALEQFQSTGEEQPYLLLMVTEKTDAMEVDPELYLQTLKDNAFRDWINEQLNTQTVMILNKSGKGDIDDETVAWLQYELQKLKKKHGLA